MGAGLETQRSRLMSRVVQRVKGRIAVSSPCGQVGSGQVMIYSGSARAISSVHGVIYLITCLSNRDHIPLFHPAPSILETSPSTCHCLSVLVVLVWSRHSQVRHLHCYRLSLGQLHSARLLSLILLHFPSKYPLRPLSAVLPTLFLLGV